MRTRKINHATTRARRRAAAGFGLIEALVATAILGFAMLAFQASAITLTRGTKGADSTAAATGLAQEQLELVRSLPRGHAGHTPGNYANPSNPITADGQANGRYTVTWTVSNRNVPDNGLKSVLITVAWNDPRPRTLIFGGLVRCAEVPCA